jgi:uncharacterized oligopeptide transporter (OPT) family protein
VLAFFFVAVAAYIVGLVGSSNFAAIMWLLVKKAMGRGAEA